MEIHYYRDFEENHPILCKVGELYFKDSTPKSATYNWVRCTFDEVIPYLFNTDQWSVLKHTWNHDIQRQILDKL